MTTIEQENTNHPPSERDPDFIAADAAILRAAQSAREKAKQTGVGVVW